MTANDDQFWRERYVQDYDSTAVLRPEFTTYKEQFDHVYNETHELTWPELVKYTVKYRLDNAYKRAAQAYPKADVASGIVHKELAAVLHTNSTHMVDVLMSIASDVGMTEDYIVNAAVSMLFDPVYYNVARHVQTMYFPDNATLAEYVPILKIIHDDDTTAAYMDNIKYMKYVGVETMIANDALKIFNMQSEADLRLNGFLYLMQAYKLKAPKIFTWLMTSRPPHYSSLLNHRNKDIDRDFLIKIVDGPMLKDFIDYKYVPILKLDMSHPSTANGMTKVIADMQRIIVKVFPYVGNRLTIEDVVALVKTTSLITLELDVASTVEFYQMILPPLDDHSVKAQRAVAAIFSGYDQCKIANAASYYLEYYLYYYTLSAMPTIPFEVIRLGSLEGVYRVSWVTFENNEVTATEYVAVLGKQTHHDVPNVAVVEPGVTKAVSSLYPELPPKFTTAYVARLTMGPEAREYMERRVGNCATE